VASCYRSWHRWKQLLQLFHCSQTYHLLNKEICHLIFWVCFSSVQNWRLTDIVQNQWSHLFALTVNYSMYCICGLGLGRTNVSSRSRLDWGRSWSRSRLGIVWQCLGLVSVSGLNVLVSVSGWTVSCTSLLDGLLSPVLHIPQVLRIKLHPPRKLNHHEAFSMHHSRGEQIV
jgi:hypothetical protein